MVLRFNGSTTRQSLQLSRYELIRRAVLLSIISRSSASIRWPGCVPQPRGRDYSTVRIARKETRRKLPWTPEEDQKLSQLVHEGYLFPAISKKFPGRTLPGVRQRWQKTLAGMPNDFATKLPSRKSGSYTREDDEKLLQLKRDGKTLAAIARDLGRSKASVTDRLSWRLIPGISQAGEQKRATGTTQRGRKWPEPILEKEMATVVYLRKKGTKWLDIAQVFPKRPIRSLQAAYYNYGLVQWDGLVSEDPQLWSDRKLRVVIGQESGKASTHSGRVGGLVQSRQQTARRKSSSAGFCTPAIPRRPRGPILTRLRSCGDVLNPRNQIRTASTVAAGVPYSEEEDKTVRTLREAGHLWKDIARKVGRSQRSVNARYHNESGYVRIRPPNVSPGGYSQEEDRLVLRLRRNGHTFAAIARQLKGRSVDSVTKHYHNTTSREVRRQRGRPFKKSKEAQSRYTKRELGTVVRLRNTERQSWPAIAKRFPGRTMASVSKAYMRVCKRLGTEPVRVRAYWSAEEDLTLVREKATGKSYAEIAKLFPDRTVSGVTSRWRKALSDRANLAQ